MPWSLSCPLICWVNRLITSSPQVIVVVTLKGYAPLTFCLSTFRIKLPKCFGNCIKGNFSRKLILFAFYFL